MDPFFHPNPLVMDNYWYLIRNHPLNFIEEMRIARHHPIMRVYGLKGRQWIGMKEGVHVILYSSMRYEWVFFRFFNALGTSVVKVK